MQKHPIAMTAALLATLTLSSAARADIIGVKAGAMGWAMNADGRVGNRGAMSPFDMDDDTMGSVWLAVEHPLPFLPNIKLRYNQMNTDGATTVNDFDFAGQIYNGRAHSSVDLDNTDIILYYELLDDIPFSLDLGVNLKYGDYKVRLKGEAQDGQGNAYMASSEESYNGVIPMVWVSTEIDLPFTGAGLFGEGSWTSYDDNDVYDYLVGGQYYLLDNLAIDLSVQVGYRKFKLDVDDLSDVYADVEFDGFFAGVQAHF